MRSSSSGLPITFKVDYGPATINSSGLVVLDGAAGEVSIAAAQSEVLISIPLLQLPEFLKYRTNKDRLLYFLKVQIMVS